MPQSPVEGGSWLAASVSNGIAGTADAIRQELLRLAQQIPSSPLAGADPADVALADGRLVSRRDGARAVSIADAMRQGGVGEIEREVTTNPADDDGRAHNTHSAVFVEVKVDEQLGVIRVTRIVSAVAAGRILNTKTAGSQILGGVVWGIGMALHEETAIDHRLGRVMNANFAEYHVPVHADVHDIKVIFVDEARRRQSARHQGRGRDRHRRRPRRDRQRGLSRHGKAGARPADHFGQAAKVRHVPVCRPPKASAAVR